MSETPFDLNLLIVFAAVVEASSFSKAAVKLGVTKGTVSRTITRLEEAVGAELLHRNTHRVALSTAGTALYERVTTHLAGLREAVQGLPERAEVPSGQLRLTAPPDFGVVVLPPILMQFGLRYPEIRFDIVLTSAYVDLVAEGFDAAIRAGAGLKDSTLTARLLGRSGLAFYAAPSYVARRGAPRSVGEDGHDWIVPAYLRGRLGLPRDLQCRYMCADFLFVREFAREGAGVGLLPTVDAEPYVRAGILERIRIPEFGKEGQATLHFVYPSSGQVPRKVTALRDFLVAHFSRVGLD